MANAPEGGRSFRALYTQERTFDGVSFIEPRTVGSKKFTGSRKGQSTDKGVVQLAAGRKLSFLDERCALCEAEKKSGGMEGRAAENATTENFQVVERRKRKAAADTRIARFGIRPRADEEKDPSEIFEPRGNAGNGVATSLAGLGCHRLLRLTGVW